MIDALDIEIKQHEKNIASIDFEPCLKGKYAELITLLKRTQASYCAEAKTLKGELNIIQGDNEEVFNMIVLHDLKRRTWEETFNRACAGLYSLSPKHFCIHIVERYLQKKGFIE